MRCRRCPCLLLLALCLPLTGCSTIESRIAQRREVFDLLPPEAQQRLREGVIAVGDTRDMVYIALGAPDRIHTRTTEEGLVEEVWAYTGTYYRTATYWPHHRHHHGVLERDHGVYFHGPEWVDVPYEYDRLRLTFRDGRVAAIDRTQR